MSVFSHRSLVSGSLPLGRGGDRRKNFRDSAQRAATALERREQPQREMKSGEAWKASKAIRIRARWSVPLDSSRNISRRNDARRKCAFAQIEKVKCMTEMERENELNAIGDRLEGKVPNIRQMVAYAK